MNNIQNLSYMNLNINRFIGCSQKDIEVSSPTDVFVLGIVTVPSDDSPVTINLQGPLIVNKLNNKCLQVVVSDPKWGTKHDILQEMKKRGTIC